MFLEKLDQWKCKNKMFGHEIDKNLFSMFLKDVYAGKTWDEAFCDVAYEVYELQMCIEGLIEDMEDMEIRTNG